MKNQTINLTSLSCPFKRGISTWYTFFFIVNMILCSVVIKCHKCESTMNRSFYKILKNLLIADLLYFGVYLIAMVPQIFTCGSFYGDVGSEYIAFGNAITFTSIASSILLMTMNRYVAICLPAFNTVVFADKRTAAWCMATWVLGAIMILVNKLTNCVARFLESSPSFYMRCSSTWMPIVGPVSIYLYLCTYGTTVFYALCMIELKKRSLNVVHEVVANSMFKKQLHVFKQAIAISLSMVTTLTTFRTLPCINDVYLRFVLNNIFGLCCIYSTPLIVIVFSSKVRARICALCVRNKVINSQTSMVVRFAAARNVPLSTK